MRSAAGLASELRVTAVMQSGLELAGLLRSTERRPSTGLHDQVVRIPVYAVGPEAYTRDETFQRDVFSHFENSLNAMVDIAVKAQGSSPFRDADIQPPRLRTVQE